ncbi:MAG: acyl-CoA dehydrogenase family protein [Sinobacteraceae bacterium]|nr:acyl-CoA dehydrogenase family protein [Nevskiaceae bacterium]
MRRFDHHCIEHLRWKTSEFRVDRRLEKISLHGPDTSELFFDDCKVLAEALFGSTEGRGLHQMMKDLTDERALAGVNCAAMIEHAFQMRRDYVRERNLFGKALRDLQNTRPELVEIKTIAKLARLFSVATATFGGSHRLHVHQRAHRAVYTRTNQTMKQT